MPSCGPRFSNWLLAPFITDLVSQEQLGFLIGRSGSDHVINLDLQALEFSRLHDSQAILFVDMEAAFPSLDHGLITRVLRRRLGQRRLAAAIIDMY